MNKRYRIYGAADISPKMKNATAKFLIIVSIGLCVIPTTGHADDDETVRINALIANYARQLDVGTVSLNWNEQPEVKKLRTFPDVKRTAAILATIWDLGQNDEAIFVKMKTNDYQVLVSMLTRIHAYTFLTNLIASSANDILLKEYLDQETTDLKQVFARKNSVAAYQQARKIRDDRLDILLKDQKFVSELVRFRAGKETVVKSLANVTTMLALIEACTTNPALCIRMDVP